MSSSLDAHAPNPRLKKEIDSWRPYSEALRHEDREVFREMISGIHPYGDAFKRAERGYDTEALIMSILIRQQKSINWLSGLAHRLRDEKKSM